MVLVRISGMLRCQGPRIVARTCYFVARNWLQSWGFTYCVAVLLSCVAVLLDGGHFCCGNDELHWIMLVYKFDVGLQFLSTYDPKGNLSAGSGRARVSAWR